MQYLLRTLDVLYVNATQIHSVLVAGSLKISGFRNPLAISKLGGVEGDTGVSENVVHVAVVGVIIVVRESLRSRLGGDSA